MKVRGEIYDHFHSSAIRNDYFLAPGNADRFAQYDVAMYLLQDTAEAVWIHRRKGFSRSPMLAYIEYWGVMQAVVIQQDALLELQEAVTGTKTKASGPAWKALRELRNISAGHPARRAHGRPAPQRAFMGRQPKTYEHLTYELWDAESRLTSHPIVQLGSMIDAYEDEASERLAFVLAYMKRAWPPAIAS
jgi:hypothetical protein